MRKKNTKKNVAKKANAKSKPSHLKLVKVGKDTNGRPPKVKKVALYILPEFQRILNPYAPEVFAKSGHNTQENEDSAKRKIRLKILVDRLRTTKYVDPFRVWKYRGKYILLEDRYLEYLAAVEIGLRIDIIEHNFRNKSEAKTFFILNLLSKSHLNAAQRILLAMQLKNYYSKKAKANQGRRTDLLPLSQKGFERIHVTKILAAAANVGTQLFNRMKKLVEKGPEVLGKEKTEEYIKSVLEDDLSITAAWWKYADKRKVKNKVESFAKEHLCTENSTPLSSSQKHNAYKNPSLDDGWQNKIVCGNNVAVLKKLPDECCSLVMYSPDYNVTGINYDVPIPVTSYAKYLKRQAPLIKQCSRILRSQGGRLAINVASTYTVGLEKEQFLNTPIWADIVLQIRELNLSAQCKLKYRTTIIWNKRFSFSRHPRGSIASPSNPCFMNNYEFIIVFSKGDWKLEPEIPGAPSDLTKNQYRDWSTSIWDLVPMSKGVKGHPAPYPESLCERAIKMLTFVGDTVIDPCVGSGTTTAVVARLGRNYFGVDISERYARNAAERTEKARQEFLKTLESKKVNRKAA